MGLPGLLPAMAEEAAAPLPLLLLVALQEQYREQVEEGRAGWGWRASWHCRLLPSESRWEKHRIVSTWHTNTDTQQHFALYRYLPLNRHLAFCTLGTQQTLCILHTWPYTYLALYIAHLSPPYTTVPCRWLSSPGKVQSAPCCSTATVSCSTCPSPPQLHRDTSLHRPYSTHMEGGQGTAVSCVKEKTDQLQNLLNLLKAAECRKETKKARGQATKELGTNLGAMVTTVKISLKS